MTASRGGQIEVAPKDSQRPQDRDAIGASAHGRAALSQRHERLIERAIDEVERREGWRVRIGLAAAAAILIGAWAEARSPAPGPADATPATAVTSTASPPARTWANVEPRAANPSPAPPSDPSEARSLEARVARASSEVVRASEPAPPPEKTPPAPAARARTWSVDVAGTVQRLDPAVARTHRIVATSRPTKLLREAQAKRSAGDTPGAAKAYRELIAGEPRSAEAHLALVSLANLELHDLRRPSRALALYERYLARGGALAQEAKWGRVRALRALGRVQAEKGAIERFLAEHPRGAYVRELRERLNTLSG